MKHLLHFPTTESLNEKKRGVSKSSKIKGSCHKRQKQQAPIHNRQTRKVANAKGLNHNNNLT